MMTRDEAANILLGKYAAGDFRREFHSIISTDPRWDTVLLSCGHELIRSKGMLVLRDMTDCNQCAQAWVDEHVTE